MSQQPPVRNEGCSGKAILLSIVVLLAFALISRQVRNSGAKLPEIAETLTTQNYDGIRIGMAWQPVEDLLGKDWKEVSTIGTMQTYIWRHGFRSITVILDNNRVAAKSANGLD